MFGVAGLFWRDDAVSRLDPQLRAAAAERLIAQRTAGLLTSAEVRRTAAGLGVDVRTVWRWLAHDRGGHPARRRYQLTEADIAAFYDWRGNVAAMRRARVEADAAGLPSLATLQRAFAEQLTPAERAAAAEGSEGRRRHEEYLRWEPVCRNARWEADHKELPVLVTPPRGRGPVKPWVTVFLDCYSRLIMGWRCRCAPTVPRCWPRCAGRWWSTRSGARSAGCRGCWCPMAGWSSLPPRWPGCAPRWAPRSPRLTPTPRFRNLGLHTAPLRSGSWLCGVHAGRMVSCRRPWWRAGGLGPGGW